MGRNTLVYIVLFLSILFVEFAYAEQKKCHTKTEVGESITGTSKIYETTEKRILLRVWYLKSHSDFTIPSRVPIPLKNELYSQTK